jgi:hypothetical protein
MFRRRSAACLLALAVSAACGAEDVETPPAPTPVVVGNRLDRGAVIDALEYWQAAAGITYVLETSGLPRLLIRPGTDGIPPWGGGRSLTDDTDDADNRMLSGLVVIEPGSDTKPAGGTYCANPGSWLCRYLYRHEIGHTLGHIGHSGLAGLMQSGSDALHEREHRMIVALYQLPFGARVEADGTWRVTSTGQSGQIAADVAADIIAWNMKAPGGSSYRSLDMISRWALPVRVIIVERTGQ